METCDVIIVGGGPAGSSCAWKLQRAGLDVIVMDRAVFPRDKVCAGWITPQVIADLSLDLDAYRRGRTLQPITGFRTGLIGGAAEVETVYDHPVSYGIRRCEFDHYLLRRSHARLKVGNGIASIRRAGTQWIINDTVKAPMLVGAGGHFCPVARWLNTTLHDAPLVVAQEAEFPIESVDTTSWPTAPEVPELYFCRDLTGYGWCFRKQQYMNIGLGRLNARSLPKASAEFVAFLRARRVIPADATWRWRGHAYLVAEPPRRRAVGDGVLLTGDAAGLAYPQSGEGIRPAIESGLLAAAAIAEAKGCYTRERIEPYEMQLQRRFASHPDSSFIISGVALAVVPWLFNRAWFVRNVLLDRWFLRASEPAVTATLQ